MKKSLLVFTLFAFFVANAQMMQDAPWMESFNIENRSTPISFQEIVDAGNSYFNTVDKDAKGSGYKPFKRWESYWQNYIGEDGFLPTSAELWNTWQQVQAFGNNRSTQADESDWTSLGLTDFINRPTSTANIGRINVVIKDPNNADIYYAGAPAGGVWKSIDAGQTWSVLTDFLPQIGVSGIAIDNNNSNIIYIATGDDDAGHSFSVGVWKSIDGGVTFQETGLNPNNSPGRMNDIYIHPTDSNILWVATDSGVFKTSDAGTTWTNTQGGNIRDIKIKPGDPTTIYAVSSSTFYKSTNGGDSFSPSTTGLPNSSGRLVIDVTPANANVVYVVSANTGNGFQGVFKSSDSGDSFDQTAETANIFESNQAWYDLALGVSDVNENELYVGVLNIWKSTDGGDDFVPINSWFQHNASYTHADIHFLRFYDGDLYCGSDGGAFKSTDQGTTFSDITGNMEITQFYRIDISMQTSTKVVGGTQDNGGYGYSNQWNHYHGGDGMEGVIDPNNDNLYYGFMQFGQNLFVSNDSGQSGNQAFTGPENGNWITPLAINSESEVYAGYSSLYRFTGSGFVAVSPSFGLDIDVLEIDPQEPDNIYVAINNGLRKSTDRGVTFASVESFSAGINSIEVNNNDSNIVYVTTAGGNGQVLKSTDGGDTFTNITGALPNVSKNTIKHRPDDPLNSLYLGTSVGIYRYDDNIGAWETFNNNLPNSSIRDLAINITDEKIAAGTFGRGIWMSDLATTELAQDDVRLVSVDQPTANSFECGEVIPQLTVKNNGQNEISTIDVTYSIDSGANTTFAWTGPLASEATTVIELPAQNLSRGEHTLDVSVNITNDAFPSNNGSILTFYINDAGVAQLVNTFEAPEDELIAFDEGGTTTLWEMGVPTGTVLNTPESGTQVYGTNLDGNHPDLTKAYLYSQCYNLSEINDPVLKFHMAFEIEQDWDLVYVEYTTDGGNSWALLGSAADPNWYNSSRIAGDGVANNCFNCVGGQWTGTDTNMQQYTYALTALTNEPEAIFRMVFHSDQSVNEEGVILDNFFVDGTLSTTDFELGNIKIYPNPSDNIFNIQLNNISKFNYSVTDITGKIVISNRNITQSNYALNMSDYATGLYFLNIEAEGRTLTKKLILK